MPLDTVASQFASAALELFLITTLVNAVVGLAVLGVSAWLERKGY